MELDSLRDHTHTNSVSCKHCDRSDGQRDMHFVRSLYGNELPPCNACFLHSMLGHCLIPNAPLDKIAPAMRPSPRNPGMPLKYPGCTPQSLS
jgi:hypothetical protein